MKNKQTPKKIALYIRFGSESKGFILPDEREAFKKYMKAKVTT